MRQFLKFFNITLVAFGFIIAIIFIKYKPVYAVSISGEEIGYVQNEDEFNKIVEENIINYDIKAVSMHGRNNSCLGPVSYNEYTFMLTGGDKKADNIINELYNAGLDYVYVYAGENLHSDNERIVSGKISDMLDYQFSSLTVLLIHNKEYVNPKTNLRDNDFIRGKAPMTKEDIRWLSACYLGIDDNDIVYDVGAGTGSCAIEFAGQAKDGLVFAVEKEDEAFELININKKNLKRHNVISIKGFLHQIKFLLAEALKL